MRFISFETNGKKGLAVSTDGTNYRGLLVGEAAYPGDLETVLAGGTLAAAGKVLAGGNPVDLASVRLLPPVSKPPKIFCLGLNYRDHAEEAGIEIPEYPTIFSRYATSLVGHGAPIIRPRISDKLDYEGELAVVIGRGGRHIPRERALDHVAGYSVFNDGSLRDYQLKTTQWLVGKTFDATGGFGPCLVTPDELPSGANGLEIQTRLNGQVVQKSNTDQLIFDVATVIALMSEAITLEAGDVFVMGTPAGVGNFRQPQLFMKPGDTCEVEIERIGVLCNPIADES